MNIKVGAIIQFNTHWRTTYGSGKPHTSFILKWDELSSNSIEFAGGGWDLINGFSDIYELVTDVFT